MPAHAWLRVTDFYKLAGLQLESIALLPPPCIMGINIGIHGLQRLRYAD